VTGYLTEFQHSLSKIYGFRGKDGLVKN